jgi:tetratricopeptide (TPR) repeat protein
MRTRHLTLSEWRKFVRAELAMPLAGVGVRHLLRGCKICREGAALAAAEEVNMVLFVERKERFSDARAWESLLPTTNQEALDRIIALSQWLQLAPLAESDRLRLIASRPGFHTLGLFKRLLDLSRGKLREDAHEAIDLCYLSLAVLRHLDSERYDPKIIADYRSNALAHVSNAARVAGDLIQAEEALNQAWESLKGGTGDPLEEALLHRTGGNLLLERRKFVLAFEAYSRAYVLYRRVGDNHMQGRTLIQQAIAVGFFEPKRGIELAQSALMHLDRSLEPRAELCARHTLIWCLNEVGRTEEAIFLLDASRRLYRQFGDIPTTARMHWLEARIAQAEGKLADAEVILRRVFQVFKEQGLPIDTTLCAIDLIEVLMVQGNGEEALSFAATFYPILKAFGMHEQGLAMWIIIQNTLQGKVIKAGAFSSAAKYYRQAWREPIEE